MEYKITNEDGECGFVRARNEVQAVAKYIRSKGEQPIVRSRKNKIFVGNYTLRGTYFVKSKSGGSAEDGVRVEVEGG